eukprot:TRINITY_DN6117_c0_g1_i1.p1 TRINITY_DN6117_c0_g1~~TRINITY_DN6117_c0_g1_i1.p1  ORF type:complete len:328 (-),score=74.25 TRINITY_DN6117_c0_g1_i1:27-917(-)
MALLEPTVRVLGISVVFGNVPVQLGTKNALHTVELLGKHDVKVYSGVASPFVRAPHWAYFYHGEDGMGNMNLPNPSVSVEATPAVTAFIEAVRAHPGDVILVTLGPLTNIATALMMAPDVATKVKQCYVMGGAANCVGNITPSAEFNIYCDPEAAKIVFHSGMPLLMVGWELCRGLANIDDTDVDNILALKTTLGKWAIDINRQAIQVNKTWVHDPGLALPDPITMAIALNPALCTKKSKCFVEVETASEVTRGMTVVDSLGVTKREPNVEVCWQIDVPLWKRMLLGYLAKEVPVK